VIVSFVNIGGIVDHHCLEVIVSFVNIGGIVDHHCLEVIETVMVNNFTYINKTNNHL
jgi:inorganic pyrophosphatase/exopolyphosphatase